MGGGQRVAHLVDNPVRGHHHAVAHARALGEVSGGIDHGVVHVCMCVCVWGGSECEWKYIWKTIYESFVSEGDGSSVISLLDRFVSMK